MNDHRAMTLNHLLINHESSPSASPEIHNPFDTSCCGYPFNRTIVRSEYKYIYIYIYVYFIFTSCSYDCEQFLSPIADRKLSWKRRYGCRDVDADTDTII